MPSRRDHLDDVYGRSESATPSSMLRPPSAGRARPPSAGTGTSANAARSGPYSGNLAFANSSTSSLNNAFHRSTPDLTQQQQQTIGHAGGAGALLQQQYQQQQKASSSSNVADATAPFLATAEMHLGRMTLTAPDNMRRRKAEEKEKRRKARKVNKAAERADQTEPRINLSSLPTTFVNVQSNTSASNTAKSRQRPAISTTRSSSNLQTLYTGTSQRPRSPTRPIARPRSAQNVTRRDASPERRAGDAQSRRQADRRVRGAQRQRPASHGSAAAGVSGDEQALLARRTSDGRVGTSDAEREAVRAEALRRASRRRRDIYADLSSLGLPGASDSDTEDTPPPPFPTNATRPMSPPAMPAEGQQWTEEMRRRQEEYMNNRPPDSPPPAFVSGDESTGHSNRPSADQDAPNNADADSTLSEEDSIDDQPISEDRRLWEEDAAAGYGLEERIQREQARQQAKEEMLNAAHPSQLPNVSLGNLVTEARARRGMQRSLSNDAASPYNGQGSELPPAQSDSHTKTASARKRDTNHKFSDHRRVASDTQTVTFATNGEAAAAEASTSAKTPRHNVNAAVGTGKGLIENSAHRTMAMRHGKVTQIRARPASESHSRFRDDASAAANRRLALWGLAQEAAAASASTSSSSPKLFDLVAPTRVGMQKDLRQSSRPIARSEENLSRPEYPARKHTSSSSGGGADDDGVESSDSEADWAKEESAFKDMQSKGLATRASALDSSDEDEHAPKHAVPGSLPQQPRTSRAFSDELPELGRVGRSIPRAPPPLVLGRSRGGAAYSSSSESSSESDNQRFREDDDPSSDSESPTEDVMAPETGHESAPLPSNASPSQATLDKGKQPMRPLPDLPASEAYAHRDVDSDELSQRRAGTFVEDSSSSHDFSDTEDGGKTVEDAHASLRDHQTASQAPIVHADESRAAVQKRLKGLFARQLSPSQQPEGQARSSNTSRASFEKLFDTALDGKSHSSAERAPSFSSSRASSERVRSDMMRRESSQHQRSSEHESAQQTSGQPIVKPHSVSSARAAEARPASAATSAFSERQARSEALESISRLQRSQEPLPQGVDRDSLMALERLLARTGQSFDVPTRTVSSDASQALVGEPSKLTRSGAISSRQSGAANGAFVNPRSVNAPRPLGRLPTITDATRHFPPSQRPSGTPSTTDGTAARVGRFSGRPPSVTGTPSWMAYIPAKERIALPTPMEPDVRATEATHRSESPSSTSTTRQTTSNRVSAMIERFEQRSAEVQSPTLGSESPVRRSPSPTASQRFGAVGVDRTNVRPERRLPLDYPPRRRPPPPPPTSGASRRDVLGTGSITGTAPPTGNFPHVRNTAENSFKLPNLPARPSYSNVDLPEADTSHGARMPTASSPNNSQSQTTTPEPPAAVAIFGNLYTAQDRSRSSNELFHRASRPLPTPPTMENRVESAYSQAESLALNNLTLQQHSNRGGLQHAGIASQDLLADSQTLQEAAQNDDRQIFNSDNARATTTAQPSEDNRTGNNAVEAAPVLPRRAPSLGITDLDLFASRLADVRMQRTGSGSGNGGVGGDGATTTNDEDEDSGHVQTQGSSDQYDDLHLLAEFLGPAKAPGLSQAEMETLPVGRVEVLRRRVVGKREDGRDKVKLALAVAGVKVERCAVCLTQFREGALACVFPCLHVLHEQCASRTLRNTRVCPTCRSAVVPPPPASPQDND